MPCLVTWNPKIVSGTSIAVEVRFLQPICLQNNRFSRDNPTFFQFRTLVWGGGGLTRTVP